MNNQGSYVSYLLFYFLHSLFPFLFFFLHSFLPFSFRILFSLPPFFSSPICIFRLHFIFPNTFCVKHALISPTTKAIKILVCLAKIQQSCLGNLKQHQQYFQRQQEMLKNPFQQVFLGHLLDFLAIFSRFFHFLVEKTLK